MQEGGKRSWVTSLMPFGRKHQAGQPSLGCTRACHHWLVGDFSGHLSMCKTLAPEHPNIIRPHPAEAPGHYLREHVVVHSHLFSQMLFPLPRMQFSTFKIGKFLLSSNVRLKCHFLFGACTGISSVESLQSSSCSSLVAHITL